MVKFFKNLFGICDHTYELLDRTNLLDPNLNAVYCILYVSRCSKCGKIQEKRIYT